MTNSYPGAKGWFGLNPSELVEAATNMGPENAVLYPPAALQIRINQLIEEGSISSDLAMPALNNLAILTGKIKK